MRTELAASGMMIIDDDEAEDRLSAFRATYEPFLAGLAEYQGAVAMSLRKAILPRVVDLLQTGSLGRAGRRFKVKGPNEIELDGTLPLAPEFVVAWLNALTNAQR